MKSLPIGVQDFKSVRKTDKYFVDKSMLIGQILDQNDCGVFLYTRPRRFGKSLNLSMLDAFFNIKYKGNDWFDGLEISKHHEYDVYKNAFPVISIDLKSCSVKDFNGFLKDFNSILFDVFDDFTYLRESLKLSEESKQLFTKYYAGDKDESDSKNAFKKLCSMLEKHHGTKVIVLMDEYDSAVNTVSDIGLRREIIAFLKGVMSSLFKGNDSLQMGIVTGVMQIIKENIFSGLNNLYVDNILSKRFDEMFGFTDSEVQKICSDYGHPEKFGEAKEWYDGYRFGNADIYNPWSILNYVSEGFEPAPYWANTSGNDILEDLLLHADDGVLKDLGTLGSGGSVIHGISASLTFDDLCGNPGSIYSLMAMSGYLKAIPGEGGYRLSIPNKELYSVFSQMTFRFVFHDDDAFESLRAFSKAILSQDVQVMERSLYALMADTLSSRVLDNEHSYQAFIAGVLMMMSGRYSVTADRESGKGYYDIRMEKMSGPGCNVVMEIKRSDDAGSRERDAAGVIRQIREKDYARGLNGPTVLYGVAFFGKEPLIVSEML